MMDPDPVQSAIDLARLSLSNQVGFSPITPAVKNLLYVVEALKTELSNLRESLQTYMKQSAPAISAARMHVPIGGGSNSLWHRDREARRKRELGEAKARQRAAMAARTDEQVKEDNEAFERLFCPDPVPEKPKRVQRKRQSKKTVRRK